MYTNEPTVVRDSIFLENSGHLFSGAGIQAYSSLVVERCTFLRNTSSAIVSSIFSYPIIRHSVFIGNSAGSHGGGLAAEVGARMENCLFLGNSAGGHVSGTGSVNPGYAGPSGVDKGHWKPTTCTIVGNSAGSVGGVAGGDGDLIENSVFWGNADQGGVWEGAQYFYIPDETHEVTNTIIQGWTGKLGGTGNSGVDPMFVDALGTDGLPWTGDEDLHLASDSPAIDAGVITASTPATDLDGHPRCAARWTSAPSSSASGITTVTWGSTCRTLPAGGRAPTGPWADAAPPPAAVYPAGCEAFDLDADGAIDLSDFAGLVDHFTASEPWDSYSLSPRD